MFEKVRNSFFSKFLWGFMGLYLLNLSIDTDDIHPKMVADNVFFNDQETIVEFVVEKILGYEDAFDEYDDFENEDHTMKKSVKIDFIIQNKNNYSNKKSFFEKRNLLVSNQSFALLKGNYLVDTPPPQI